MYIRNKLVSSFYKLSLGLISVYGFWMTLATFGATAWRLFSTWALMIGAIYFCISALILALSSKRESGDVPCPMLEGALIVAFLLQAVTAIACAINDEYFPGLSGFVAVLAYYILPVLTLLDWCLFNKKGLWRAVDPFYWLALPLSYSAMIILTANMLPSSTALLYPVAFLDYNTYGLWEMLGWLALIGLLILIFGYILILLDAFMGGVIAKHIVLPRIRTVTVDDEGEPLDEDAQPVSNPIANTTETASEEINEEIEVVEPDEIITAQPETSQPKSAQASSAQSKGTQTNSARSKSAQPKPAHAQAASQSRPAQATARSAANKSNKTPKSSNSQKPAKNPNAKSGARPSGKRKINDITKPKVKN